MTDGLTPQMLALILFCVLAETIREICFKQSAGGGSWRSALLRPVTWVGILFWGVELAAWTFVLANVPLSVAFPMMALSYVAIVFAGRLIFKEHISFRHAAGVLCITAGVACVGATAT